MFALWTFFLSFYLTFSRTNAKNRFCCCCFCCCLHFHFHSYWFSVICNWYMYIYIYRRVSFFLSSYYYLTLVVLSSLEQLHHALERQYDVLTMIMAEFGKLVSNFVFLFVMFVWVLLLMSSFFSLIQFWILKCHKKELSSIKWWNVCVRAVHFLWKSNIIEQMLVC